MMTVQQTDLLAKAELAQKYLIQGLCAKEGDVKRARYLIAASLAFEEVAAAICSDFKLEDECNRRGISLKTK